MVTSWVDNYNAGVSVMLLKQVTTAAISCSSDIQGEALASVSVPPGVPAAITQQEMHNRRSQLSYRILNGAGSTLERMNLAVAVNLDLYLTADGQGILKGTGDVAPTKVEIKNSVSALWNYFALDCKAV